MHALPALGCRLLSHFIPQPLDGMEHHLGGALQVQLVLDTIAEGVDGRNGKAEILGNLAHALALAQHLEDLQFAITEAFDGGFVRFALAANDAGQH